MINQDSMFEESIPENISNFFIENHQQFRAKTNDK